MEQDTIFALATALGKAGVAVVRISGDQALEALSALGVERAIAPRRATLSNLKTPDGHLIDRGLIQRFPQGQSFTGEEVVEFHLHGSPAVVSAVLDVLAKQEGFRHAVAGEFTRRALENDCLDLAQVEGLSDLVNAETEAQRRQAVRVFSGGLGALVEEWRAGLIRAAALIEATIDFADEEVPIDVAPEVNDILDRVLAELRSEIEGSVISERIRDGFEVAIVGPPNVGKSTLLNALAGRDAAITSDIAGTTRDVIEVRMDLRGLPVTVLDTAGLQATDDLVEKIGVERARARAQDADLRVFLLEDPAVDLGMAKQNGDLLVHAKADLNGSAVGLAVSGKTGQGLDQLIDAIASDLSARSNNAATATHARHRQAMQRAVQALEDARIRLGLGSGGSEIAAEDLRNAIRSLESLVGRIDVEDVLGDIFSQFCIGK
ncbi:MAG: tRNA uridine-5-carboxymethylaminomethyl(34) synthesis GTPase MnmE [Pseudomonadota bacterium]